MGDIFDRGDEVTELLWFIHSLQKKAHEADGNVHLLLGNHELMNLVNDDRYISDKYFFLSLKTGVAYSETFGKSYELGKWLRSLNTMIKINDILFVHAGISREMLERNLSIQEVNAGMRQFLAFDADTTNQDLLNFLTGETGPLWFRGFSHEASDQDQESSDNFEKIMEYYNAKRIIVGHTPAQKFRVYFDNRLIYVDVSSAEGNMDEKALLIENNNYYKVFLDGRLEPLF
jgi:hypothetical protein